MRISKVLYFFCAAFSLFLHPGPAEALELRVSSENAYPGDSIAVEITVQEYDQEAVAAAAVTITYSADNMVLNEIESDFFSTFLEQWHLSDPVLDPLPPASVEMNDQTYVQPLVLHTADDTSTGKVSLAAARLKAGTPTVLFTLNFTIKNSAIPGVYPLSITSTVVNNTEAGYDAAGEAVPMLIGAVEGEATPLLTYPVYSPNIINGSISIQQEFVDTDNDGIDDNWERSFFNALTSLSGTGDFDQDGYSDLQEYLNDLAGKTDPQGDPYNPKIQNAPGGTGYTPAGSEQNSFLLLLLPAILSGAR
ncbi:MAG: cohesin domain-containing protein [Candidatus Electrothrix sp. Rat3]|nr:cohesin domain-containing protein [Candidatus Electrothrix rattekaaiensis]